MSHLAKILVAVALAIAAFVGNRIYLTNMSREMQATHNYVRVSSELVPDGTSVFTEDVLSPVGIRTDGDAALSAVPWEKKEILYGAPVRRHFRKNEIVLLSDIRPAQADLALQDGERDLIISMQDVQVEPGLLKVGRYVGFVTDEPAGGDEYLLDEDLMRRYVELGPFRIVSVGVTIEEEDSDAVHRGNRARTIGVATTVDEQGRLNEEASRLLAAAEEGRLQAVTLFRFDQQRKWLTTGGAAPSDNFVELDPEGFAPDDGSID